MSFIKLKEENEVIIFLDTQEGHQEIYFIPITDLSELRMSKDTCLSEWISQLNETSWAYPDLLYRLAKIIQDKFPENVIDWNATFFQVEKKDYLEKFGDITKEFNTSLVSPVEELEIAIRQGQQEDVSEVNDKISDLVTKHLKEYKIVAG